MYPVSKKACMNRSGEGDSNLRVLRLSSMHRCTGCVSFYGGTKNVGIQDWPVQNLGSRSRIPGHTQQTPRPSDPWFSDPPSPDLNVHPDLSEFTGGVASFPAHTLLCVQKGVRLGRPSRPCAPVGGRPGTDPQPPSAHTLSRGCPGSPPLKRARPPSNPPLARHAKVAAALPGPAPTHDSPAGSRAGSPPGSGRAPGRAGGET